MNPLVAGVIGFFAFDQKLGIVQLIAGVILLIGVYLVFKSETVAVEPIPRAMGD